MKRLNRVIEGLTTVSFGLMLLANSAGILSWRVWLTLLSLWPLLLIAIGIDIIGKGAKQHWLRVISSLLVLGGLAWVVFAGPAGGLRWGVPWQSATATSRFEETDARGIMNASIDISLPLVSLTVDDDPRGLVRIEAETPFDPDFNVSTRGTAASVSLDSDRDGPFVTFGGQPRTEVLLGQGDRRDPIAWEIVVDTAVTEGEMDLSELAVAGVEVNAGITVLDVTLGVPETGSRNVPVAIDGGVMDVTIRVPRGTEFRVEGEIGLGSVNVDDELDEDGAAWQTAGFDDAEESFLIRSSGGMGSLDVRYY